MYILVKAKKFVLCLNYIYLDAGVPNPVVLVSAPVQPDNVALPVDSAAQELLTVRDLIVNLIMGQLAMETSHHLDHLPSASLVRSGAIKFMAAVVSSIAKPQGQLPLPSMTVHICTPKQFLILFKNTRQQPPSS